MDRWTKSSYSGGRNPDCVECRADQDRVLVRDSQHPTHTHLAFPAPEWRALLTALHTEEL